MPLYSRRLVALCGRPKHKFQHEFLVELTPGLARQFEGLPTDIPDPYRQVSQPSSTGTTGIVMIGARSNGNEP